jgi:hypothetical protein
MPGGFEVDQLIEIHKTISEELRHTSNVIWRFAIAIATLQLAPFAWIGRSDFNACYAGPSLLLGLREIRRSRNPSPPERQRRRSHLAKLASHRRPGGEHSREILCRTGGCPFVLDGRRSPYLQSRAIDPLDGRFHRSVEIRVGRISARPQRQARLLKLGKLRVSSFRDKKGYLLAICYTSEL